MLELVGPMYAVAHHLPTTYLNSLSRWRSNMKIFPL